MCISDYIVIRCLCVHHIHCAHCILHVHCMPYQRIVHIQLVKIVSLKYLHLDWVQYNWAWPHARSFFLFVCGKELSAHASNPLQISQRYGYHCKINCQLHCIHNVKCLHAHTLYCSMLTSCIPQYCNDLFHGKTRCPISTRLFPVLSVPLVRI